MTQQTQDPWLGLNSSARSRLETRDYHQADICERLASTGLPGGELISKRAELSEEWIPGVEVFPRRVFQQKGRGYFAELTRLNEGPLQDLGLNPQQWASALMHRESAKGFHIHPPHIPDGYQPEDWFRHLFLSPESKPEDRLYHLEQWDVMFFLTSICEFFLVDERAGMPRRKMRFTISGDNLPGPDNVALVIPPGVSHALMNTGHQDLIMVYGTSTSFNPLWEGRIDSAIENCDLPQDWEHYLQQNE